MQDAGETSHYQVQHIKHAASHPRPQKRETKCEGFHLKQVLTGTDVVYLLFSCRPFVPSVVIHLHLKPTHRSGASHVVSEASSIQIWVFLNIAAISGPQSNMLHVSAFASRHPALSASIMGFYNGRRPTPSLHVSTQSHPFLNRVGVGSSIWKFLFERVEIEHSGVKLTSPP
jgi:hypothetical protein